MSSFSSPDSDRPGLHFDDPDPDSGGSELQNEHVDSEEDRPEGVHSDYSDYLFPHKTSPSSLARPTPDSDSGISFYQNDSDISFHQNDSDASFYQNETDRSTGISPVVKEDDYNSQLFPNVASGLGPSTLTANGPRNEMDEPIDFQSEATGRNNGNGLTYSNITPDGFDLLSAAATELSTGRANSEFLFVPNHANYVDWSHFQQQEEQGHWVDSRPEVGTLESPSTAEPHRPGPIRSKRGHSKAMTRELVSRRNSLPPAAPATANALEETALHRVARIRE